ncbi:methyl-accepting chemotaxis protein [Halorubellus salinus]|uniref:methyl-accepting chemotaxis protein n=1 Tax=Halorubellus salinus TaxID=755309 RepID=UPI001D074B95|nr:methyl-accepting chemotaxis protein [Halorubellus salinus]
MFGPLRRVVPDAIRRRYALKFGIVLLCLGVVVAGIGVAATTQVQDEVEAGAKAEYEQISRQESAKLATWNERNGRLASHLSGTLAVRRGELAEIEALFENRTDRPGIYRLDYVDLRESEVVVSTRRAENRSLSELDVTDTERLRRVATADGGGFYGAYERNSVEAMTYAAATPDGDHAILVTMDAGTVAADLKGSTENGAVVVIDPEKRIVFDSESEEGTGKYLTTYDAPRADQYVKSTAESAGFSQSVVTGPASGVLVGDDGYQLPRETYLAGYSPVEGTDWVVVVHEPTGTAFGFVKQVQQYGLLVTAGIVVLIGVVGLVLGRNTAQSIDDLRRKAERMEEGDLNVDFETHRIDAIGQLYVGFASMRDALRDQIREARTAREAAEDARAEAERTNEHLEQKADEYSEVMQACADGDLTERMNPESESDAMASIAVEFNEMVAEIEATTAEVKAFASEVATASEEVTASSEEVRSASQQVTESIQEISDGAERQNESLQSVSGEMEQLSTTTEEIAASSNEVADLAERTAETGREGRDAAEAAIEGMAELESESESAVAAIEDLESEMSEIDELIEFIGDIAKETNMLALNANIEASRGSADASGDGDEGFAVVAQEVKELASETKDAAEDIEARLERIQDQTEHTAGEVQQTADRVAEHTQSVRDAAGALDEIAEYAAETNDGVQEISAATEQQAASTEEVVAMVDDAATISEETTAEAENVAAAAEEQTTALTEVSNSASSLSEQASRLSAALDRFDTAAEPEDDVTFDDETVASAFEEHAQGQTPPADESAGALDEPEFDAFDAEDAEGASPDDSNASTTSDTGGASDADGDTSADTDGSSDGDESDDDEPFTFDD